MHKSEARSSSGLCVFVRFGSGAVRFVRPPTIGGPSDPHDRVLGAGLGVGKEKRKGHESQQHVAGGLNRTDDVGGANAVREKEGKERNRTDPCESMELCTDTLPLCG